MSSPRAEIRTALSFFSNLHKCLSLMPAAYVLGQVTYTFGELSFLSYSLEIIIAPSVIRSLYELNEIQFAHGLALRKYSMTPGCVISLENIPTSLI